MFFKPNRYFFCIFLLQFAFYTPIFAQASSKNATPSSPSTSPISDTIKKIFNKGLAAITDLNFRSNHIGKRYLIPVDLMAQIETPNVTANGSVQSVQPGKANAMRQNYQSASFRNVMTSGLRVDSDVTVNPACKDIGSQMQWLYTYYVFPLNCERETCDPIDEVPDCVVAAKKVLDAADNFTLYVKALKAAWTDSIRIETCPFYNWQKTDENGSDYCKASSGLFTARQAWKDQVSIIKPALEKVATDEIVCTGSTGARNEYCDNNPIRSSASDAISGIKEADMLASKQSSSFWNKGSTCYIRVPESRNCPDWLRLNWGVITGSVKPILKPVLEKLVKGYIVYAALEGKRVEKKESKPSRYSIVNLLRPYGYSMQSQIDAATSFINILANASQLPTVLVPGDEPVSSNNNQGPVSSPCQATGTIAGAGNVFYALGKKIGGSGSTVDCPFLPQKGQRVHARKTAKNRLSLDSFSFNQNMRTLAAGQTLLLSNFYDAIVRRIINPGGSFDSQLHTMNNFIRPDWRTTSVSSGPLDQTVEPVVLLPKWLQDSKSNNASTEMGNGEAWRKTMRSASPADVQREILFALADMLGVVYQSQLLEERLLITMSFQGLQAMSGSGLMDQTRFYQDAVVQDVYTFATGTTAPQNSQGGKLNSPSAANKSSTRSGVSTKSSAKSMANKYSDKINSTTTSSSGS